MGLEYTQEAPHRSTSPSRDGSGPESEEAYGAGSSSQSALDFDGKPQQMSEKRCSCQIKRAKEDIGWRKIVRNFSPA
jgi:hypothetical protein